MNFSDNILKEEIDEIEDLYNYVKSLVKSRLNQTLSGLPDPLQVRRIFYLIHYFIRPNLPCLYKEAELILFHINIRTQFLEQIL